MDRDMSNFYHETLNFLNENKKKPRDVRWIGSLNGDYSISWKEFKELAEDHTYSSDFGGQEIPQDIVVVGNDWWLERGEYDGREWWKFKSLPFPSRSIKPKKIKRLRFGQDIWFTVKAANTIGGEYNETEDDTEFVEP